MGWGPQCYIPSFVKIGLPVLEKKIFEGFLPYMGVAAILVMWLRCPRTNFRSPLPKEAPHKIWLWLAKRFQRRRSLKLLTTDGRRRTTTTDDGRTPDHGYPISSPMSLRLRWAKKTSNRTGNSYYSSQLNCHIFSLSWKCNNCAFTPELQGFKKLICL